MMMTYIIAGLVLLGFGAELLVKGSVRIASLFGISPFLVGLTIVALGTSTPEIAVSLMAALAGNTSVSVGNVLGSNIMNILIVLGLSALVAPLIVSAQMVKREVPIMIALTLIVFLLALDGILSRIDGILLCVLLSAFIRYTIVFGKKEQQEQKERQANKPSPDEKRFSIIGMIGLILIGLGFLTFGSNIFVKGAVELARHFGISEFVIGATVVAFGTSLPEIVTSMVAVWKNERDLVVGNVLGSNIFNLLAVLGITCIFSPNALLIEQGVLNFDFPVLLAVSFACLPIFFIGHKVGRSKGALFLFYYACYSLYILLKPGKHPALTTFEPAMLYFVIPLTCLTLGVFSFRQWQASKTKK